ncbi:hypothetical protein ACFLXX_05560 [Chloroflexota bacterium]
MEKRPNYIWHLLWRGKWKPIEVAMVVIGLYDTGVSQFAPNSGLPTLSNWIPQWQWQSWIILLLVLVLIAIVEGSYRREQEPTHTGERMLNPQKRLNKLQLVINAIEQAKQITPTSNDVVVYIADANGLTRILPQEIKDILVKLQHDERVLTMKSFPEWLLPTAVRDWNKAAAIKQLEVALDPSKNHFVVSLGNSFDKQYKRMMKKGKL